MRLAERRGRGSGRARGLGSLAWVVVLPAVVLPAVVLPACGSRLRVAPAGAPPVSGAEAVVVDYPPPPAQVEIVPRDPGKPCVWVDGHWEWQGRRWRWQTGSWLRPPPACYYSTQMLVWLPAEGASPLYYWPPRWYPRSTARAGACDRPVPCGAAAAKAAASQAATGAKR